MRLDVHAWGSGVGGPGRSVPFDIRDAHAAVWPRTSEVLERHPALAGKLAHERRRAGAIGQSSLLSRFQTHRRRAADDPEPLAVTVADDHHQHVAPLRYGSFGKACLEYLAGNRRRQLNRGFGRLHLAQGLEGGDLLTRPNLPRQHLRLMDAFAEVR